MYYDLYEIYIKNPCMQQEDLGEREAGGGENDLILGIQDLDFDFNTLAKFLGIQDLSIHLKVFQGILGIWYIYITSL